MEHKRPGGDLRPDRGDEPTKSQLLPFSAGWQDLASKSYFVPGVVVCAAMALLFTTNARRDAAFVAHVHGVPVGVPTYALVLSLLILSAVAWATYRMAGKQKAWWVMPLAAVFTATLLASPAWPLTYSALDIGIVNRDTDGLLEQFVKMFLTVGLREEVFKAFPILLGALVAVRMNARTASRSPIRQVAVFEPIDGILIGAASGLGFAFYETLFQYVPTAMLNSKALALSLAVEAQKLGIQARIPDSGPYIGLVVKLYELIARAIGPVHAQAMLNTAIADAQGAGLQLLIPRLMQFGHGAYSGILGYFIGLAVMRPRGRVKTVCIGLAVAAGIHALWNTLAPVFGIGGQFAVMLLAFAGLAAAIAKARAISPERASLVPSQVIDRFAGGWQGNPDARPAGFEASVSQGRAAPAVAPKPAAVERGAAATHRSITWDTPDEIRMLEIGSVRFPLTLGSALQEVHAPGVRSMARDGIVGTVNANPAEPDVLGIRNQSDVPWTVTLPGGATRTLLPGRSIQVVAGMRIRLGDHIACVR